jgi:hypothetical protein
MALICVYSDPGVFPIAPKIEVPTLRIWYIVLFAKTNNQGGTYG